jgi:murein DD-endopeptidase MepM/ murein hydrolase activator NlpD
VGGVLPALAPALLLALLLAQPAAGLQDAGGGQAAGGSQAEGGATAEPEQEQSAQDSDTIDQGRSVAAQVAAGESDALFARMTTEMRGAFGGVDGLKTFLAQVADQLGAERAVLSETEERAPGVHVYVRTSRHEKLEIPIVLQVAFNSKGAVAGMFVRPVQTEAQSEHLERETVAALSLPFEGEWDVFWGGRSVAQNYHAAHADQRFAYDILALVDGTSHTGEGKRNEDYHCWDRAIRSPGVGKVVAAVDGVEDNAPGVMNPRQPVGNHVIIDHGNGEFSFLAHFRKGTLAVDVGQDVTAATLLGRCGNSGNSSEPHLHYHLQDTAVFGKGVGLPSQFLDYVADGEPVARGEPVRGQSIRRAP